MELVLVAIANPNVDAFWGRRKSRLMLPFSEECQKFEARSCWTLLRSDFYQR